MGKVIKRCSLILGSVALTLLMVFEADAQDRRSGFLNLSVGSPHDEQIPEAPTDITVDGTFRKFTKIEFNPETKTLRFTPKNVGVGTVVVTDRAGKVVYEFTVDVRKTDLEKVVREIKSLLNTIDGIAVRILNNKVVVDGQILLPSDMKRIHSVVKQYGGMATSLVTLSPAAQNKIAQFIEKKINNPEVRVAAVNNKFILEGMVDSPEEKTRAEIIAKMYVPDVVIDEAVADKKVLERKADVVINMISVRPAPDQEPGKIVQLVVHFVELQKDYNRAFRFQWRPDIGDGSSINFSSGGRSPGGVAATITGTISNLLPKLNWAKEHGFARVLQSTSIAVEDSKKGTLNSITRLPYQVVNAQGQPSTNFEETGLRAAITPRILGARSDSVKLEMSFAVKSLISYSAQGPLTSSREIETTIHVRSGQSAAVGGLITSDTGTNYNKLPADSSRNPIISLYASKDFRNNQSQFVVFVTPIIKSSASSGSEEIKRKFRLTK
ncbi:MAG: pilus assembly protein [Bdellovibrionales bacterium]